MNNSIQLPSKPEVITEEGFSATYKIEGLYPGYGHTLGNSLRRIILSSLPGAAITQVRIDGVQHEFSTIEGVREDVITILLNLKKVRMKLTSDEAQTITLNVKGPKEVTAADIEAPGQVEIMNKDQYIATVSGKNELKIEMTVENGLGYISKKTLQEEKMDVGTIALDALFSPVQRVSYEVESMRVGERTDFNRLKVSITTDGTVTPREVLEHSIALMIQQLQAIVGFKEPVVEVAAPEMDVLGDSGMSMGEDAEPAQVAEADTKEFLKTRVESLGLSARTENALTNAGIRTVGGLVRKSEQDVLELDGLGEKGVQEIKRVLGNYGILLQ